MAYICIPALMSRCNFRSFHDFHSEHKERSSPTTLRRFQRHRHSDRLHLAYFRICGDHKLASWPSDDPWSRQVMVCRWLKAMLILVSLWLLILRRFLRLPKFLTTPQIQHLKFPIPVYFWIRFSPAFYLYFSTVACWLIRFSNIASFQLDQFLNQISCVFTAVKKALLELPRIQWWF